jgi:gliding motility-associated-like protein
MRKIFTLLSLFFIGSIAIAQDLSVTNITAPVSGCALTATENVTIKVFNFGPTLMAGSTFNVSYTINGGAPVTELVTLAANLATNSTLTYTFTTQANLSAGGAYLFASTVTIAGDVNPSNDAFSGYTVTNTTASVGGTVAGGTNVCTGSNSGNLTLSGQTGSVLNWEYSTDGGGTWISISNTTTTQSYLNLTVPTQYRAQVQNGTCTSATSSIASMTIDPTSVGGSVTGTTSVCSGANSGTVNSTGRTGAILKWQFSTDGGLTWTDIANTTSSQAYLNLTTTTRYRVQVQSGACNPVFSSAAIITVNPVTVGGTVNASATVCSGSNSGTLTLSGHTGTVQRWEFSTDGGTIWTTIANTTTTQNYLNLTTTTMYRAVVKSGTCATANSAAATITVTAATVAGSPSSSATVCSGANSGVITLTGYTGTINFWQYSTDGGATFTTVANTTDTISYLNLTSTRIYRANVVNGSCTAANSTTATITVNPVSVGGTLAVNDTVCSGANSGTITLSGHTGSIVNWESSTDGITWTGIANTTTTQAYLNLVATTYYRANVMSGVCPATSSSVDTITVDQPSVGGTIAASANVCYGNNSGTLTLSGHTGSVVRWEYSIDGGINWINITNTTPSYIYTNITLTTIYRAIVQNGTCSTAISGTATLTVDPVSVGGTVNGSTTACGGSNSGTLDLISYVGTITGWESSIDGGLTWTPIANTTATENYINITQTTLYHVIVQSGVCSQDTSSVATITVDPPSDGGILTMDDTVCASSNFGTLSLSGFTGTIQHWESSTDGGLTWLTLANTTASQTYMNLAATTTYRVNVKSGVCNAVTSNAVTITVDPVPMGGSISGGTTVCDTINSGTLTLTGSVGNISNWMSSTDGGATWTSIANTTTTLNYTNLTDTTWFAAVLSSGLCGMDTSATATVYVNPLTNGGTLAMDDTVCTGLNNGTLNLTGQVGTILGWEFTTDGGFNWTPLSNTTDSLTYNNLTGTTGYHVIVQSGICASAASNTVTITVDPAVMGGTLSGSTTVCDTINSGTLTLTGSVGSVINWLSSTDGGMTWSAIANTTTTLNYTNLTDTTWFQVAVMSGVCGNDTSTIAVVNVNPATVGGMVTMDDTVCSGMNGGTLYLGGQTGTVMGWEFSTDGGTNWIPLANTTDSLTYVNLTMTTAYHAIVQSGICSADTSMRATITVNPVSNAGMITGAMPGCEGANGAVLTVTGYTGAISGWNSSIDAGATWTAITNITDTLSYSNLTDTTWYNVIVQSGVCAADTSSAVTVVVYPKPVAMYSADTVCFGVSTTFANASTVAGGFIQFNQWDFGDGNSSLAVNPIHNYSAAGIYPASLTTISNFGCMDTAMVSVLVNAVPSSAILASGPLTFCSGDSLMLSATSGTYSYMWSTTDTVQTIGVITSGTFVLTVTDTLTGCMAMDSVTTVVNPSPTVYAGADTTVSLGNSLQLSATGGGIISWTWFPNIFLDNSAIADPVTSPIYDVTYQVTGTDFNGCTDVDSITITVIADYNVTVSNLMTPNDDGFNDRWMIGNIENYPDTKVIVVDREGQVVFSSDSYDNSWDGTTPTGKLLPDGTYYYFLEFKEAASAGAETPKMYKGSITILRQK